MDRLNGRACMCVCRSYLDQLNLISKISEPLVVFGGYAQKLHCRGSKLTKYYDDIASEWDHLILCRLKNVVGRCSRLTFGTVFELENGGYKSSTVVQ